MVENPERGEILKKYFFLLGDIESLLMIFFAIIICCVSTAGTEKTFLCNAWHPVTASICLLPAINNNNTNNDNDD